MFQHLQLWMLNNIIRLAQDTFEDQYKISHIYLLRRHFCNHVMIQQLIVPVLTRIQSSRSMHTEFLLNAYEHFTPSSWNITHQPWHVCTMILPFDVVFQALLLLFQRFHLWNIVHLGKGSYLMRKISMYEIWPFHRSRVSSSRLW